MINGNRVVRIAELEIDPSQLDAYRMLLIEEIEASIANEEGVISLQAVAMKDDSHRIRILEIYADTDAYQAHLKTEHFLKYKTATAGMVTSLTLMDMEPIIMRGKP